MAPGSEQPQTCGWRKANSGDGSQGSNLPGDFKCSPFIVGSRREGPKEGKGNVRTRKSILDLGQTLGEDDMPGWVTLYAFLTQIYLPRGDQ